MSASGEGSSTENKCIICGTSLSHGDTDIVREKGIKTLINSSEKRKDNKVELFRVHDSVVVHQKCRKLYTNEKAINAAQKRSFDAETTVDNSRSLNKCESFSFKEKCFFCGKIITEEFLKIEARKPRGKRNEVYKVRSSNTKVGIEKAANYHGDDWSSEVVIYFNFNTTYYI